jgi:hypothetical protein
LARRGTPIVPADLVRHDCILYTRLATGNRWHFAGHDGPIAGDVGGRFRADNSEAVREAVLGGAGIAVVPVWLFPDEIGAGQVDILLEQFEPKQLPVHAVYPSRRQLAAKVRAMIDFLAAEFEISPLLSAYGASDAFGRASKNSIRCWPLLRLKLAFVVGADRPGYSSTDCDRLYIFRHRAIREAAPIAALRIRRSDAQVPTEALSWLDLRTYRSRHAKPCLLLRAQLSRPNPSFLVRPWRSAEWQLSPAPL